MYKKKRNVKNTNKRSCPLLFKKMRIGTNKVLHEKSRKSNERTNLSTIKSIISFSK